MLSNFRLHGCTAISLHDHKWLTVERPSFFIYTPISTLTTTWLTLFGFIRSSHALTQEDRDLIVEFHNALRGKVNQLAANMGKMVRRLIDITQFFAFRLHLCPVRHPKAPHRPRKVLAVVAPSLRYQRIIFHCLPPPCGLERSVDNNIIITSFLLMMHITWAYQLNRSLSEKNNFGLCYFSFDRVKRSRMNSICSDIQRRIGSVTP